MEEEKTNKVNLEKGENEEVTLDKILIDDIGQFGLYQLRTLCLCFVVAIFAGTTANQFVFTMAQVKTRCEIPECETASSSQFLQPWILNAVPSSGATFDNCHRYNVTAEAFNLTESCPANIFDRESIVKCENYVFEDKNTGIYELDIPCDEWRRSLVGFANVIGFMICLPMTGVVADRYGRKFALTFNAFSLAWIGATKYFATSYTMYTLLEFTQQLFGACGFTSAYIIALEFVGPKYRVAAGASLSSSLAVGTTLEGLIAWTQPYWRHLILIIHLPQLLTIVYFWIMPESIRWLMSKGRYEESKIMLEKAARLNRKVLSEKTIKSLTKPASESKETKSDLNEPWLIVQVFRHKRILLRCLVSPILWISALFVYYGLSISSVGITGNKYVNFSIVSAVEIPGYWTAVLLMNRIGRKPLIITAFWICAICQFAYIFMPDGYYELSLIVYLIGKWTISTVMTSIYVYTAELYPTRYRTSLFSFSSMMGRVGACIAPLTPALGSVLWVHLPFALFGGMAFLSGLLTMLLPETLGTVLPDTMEQAANIGKKSSDCNELER